MEASGRFALNNGADVTENVGMGTLELEQRNLNACVFIQIAVGVVSAKGKNVVPFFQFGYPKFSSKNKTLVSGTIPKFQCDNRIL